MAQLLAVLDPIAEFRALFADSSDTIPSPFILSHPIRRACLSVVSSPEVAASRCDARWRHGLRRSPL